MVRTGVTTMPAWGRPSARLGAVQGHKVADVVRDQDSAVCGGVLQKHGVGPTLLMEIVDVVGINTVLSQLWREGGMDVFVQEEDQRDGSVFPCWYAWSSRWISSSISAR